MTVVPALVAVDVAILPPAHVTQVAFALSAALPAAESQGFRLDATHLPHITLTQQFVPADALPRAIAVIGEALHARPPLRLRVTGPGRGSRSVWMRIEPDIELGDLHRALMDKLRPLERRTGGPAAFAGGDPRPGDVRWVSRFRLDASGSRYTPHITLGYASQPPRVEPSAFDAETIALCHLGRFCACREVLHVWTLTSVGPRRDDPPGTRPRLPSPTTP